jgi:hypothetical protein
MPCGGGRLIEPTDPWQLSCTGSETLCVSCCNLRDLAANSAQRAGITRPAGELVQISGFRIRLRPRSWGSGFVSGMNIQSMARANKPMTVMLKKPAIAP